MRNGNIYFIDKEDSKVIRRNYTENECLDVIEMGYGPAKPVARYVLVRNCYILQFVTAGRGKFCGESFEAGDVLAIRPGQIEIREPDLQNLYNCTWIMMRGTIAAELLNPIYPKESCVLHTDHTQKISNIIKKAINDFYENREVSLKFEMLSVFYSVLSYLKDEEESEPTDPVSMATAYLNMNYKDNKLKISDVSNFVGITQNHLCKLFKKETGKSTMDALLDIRLSNALVLLKNTRVPIGEVAYSVGFSDPKHFSQMFKRKFGLTPGEYRLK